MAKLTQVSTPDAQPVIWRIIDATPESFIKGIHLYPWAGYDARLSGPGSAGGRFYAQRARRVKVTAIITDSWFVALQATRP